MENLMKISKIDLIYFILIFYIFLSVYSPVVFFIRIDQLLMPLFFLFYLISKYKYKKWIFIELLAWIFIIQGTIATLFNTKNIIALIAGIEPYVKVLIAIFIFRFIVKYNKIEQTLRIIIYYLLIPSIIIFLLYLLNHQLARSLIDNYFLKTPSTQWKFSGIFDLPYIASVFFGTILFITMFYYKFFKGNVIAKFLNYFFSIVIGIFTLSKTFLLYFFIFLLIFIKKNLLKIYILIPSILIIYVGIYYLYNFIDLSRLNLNVIEAVIHRYSEGNTLSQNFIYYKIYYILGLGYGANITALDSFYAYILFSYGILMLIFIVGIIIYFLIKFFIQKKYILFYYLLFLAVGALGSYTFISNRSEIVIWLSILVMNYIYNFQRISKNETFICNR
jgi:hypothetical protein